MNKPVRANMVASKPAAFHSLDLGEESTESLVEVSAADSLRDAVWVSIQGYDEFAFARRAGVVRSGRSHRLNIAISRRDATLLGFELIRLGAIDS